MATALLLYAFLSRVFGPTLFGAWGVVLSVLAWFEIFITSGLVRSATKTISEDAAEMPRAGRAVYVGQLTVGLGIFAAIQLLAGPIARLLSDASLAPLIRLSAFDVPLYALFMAASATVLGAKRFERQGVVWFVYATSKALLVAFFVRFGASLPGALIGNALSSGVGFIAMYVPLGKRDGSVSGILRGAARMTVSSSSFLAISLVEGVERSVDLWLVAALFAGTAAIGRYASAAKLAEIPVFLFLGLNRVVFPAIAAARAEGDHERASAYAAQAVRVSVIVTVLGIALVTVAGRTVLSLVFSGWAAAAAVPAALLMFAGMGRTIRATCAEVLLAEDRRRSALLVLATSVVLEIAFVLALARAYGLAGAAAGAGASALLASMASALLLTHDMGLRPFVTGARSLIAAAVITIPIELTKPAAPWLVLILPAALVAYVVLLRVLGEFSPADLTLARQALGLGRPQLAPVRRLLVNADDYGWARGINEGIVEAHERGIVTSASLLAGGHAFDDAVERAAAVPTLALGLHLDIYRGRPVLPPERVPSLLGPGGRFLGSWERIAGRLMLGRIDLAEVEAEWRAQIERVMSAGIRPVHLDSEKHLHMWPSLFRIVCRLAVEYDIPRVRLVREPLSARPIPLGLTILSYADGAIARRNGVAVSERTAGVSEPPTDWDHLTRALRSARGSFVELVVHPGYLDAQFYELQKVMPNELVGSRVEELNVLASTRARDIVESLGFELGGAEQTPPAAAARAALDNA